MCNQADLYMKTMTLLAIRDDSAKSINQKLLNKIVYL